MLKNVFYRKTGEDYEFWFEFEEQILHHSSGGEFSIVTQIPDDAQEIPRTDDPQNTGNLHHSIPGGRLEGIYHDEPYTLKLDNGSAISIEFGHTYSDPTLGDCFYTLDFYSAEYISDNPELKEALDEICVESNRVCMHPSGEKPTVDDTPAPPPAPVSGMQQIRRLARYAIAGLSILVLIILTYQIEAQAKPGWLFSRPICRFAAYLFHPGLPLMGTLCCFLFIHGGKERYKLWLIPVIQTLMLSHALAFTLFLLSGKIALASTMGDDAIMLIFIGSLVTLPRLIPGIIMYLILCCAGQASRTAMRNISEVTIYTILIGTLLWLGGMLIFDPFDFRFTTG